MRNVIGILLLTALLLLSCGRARQDETVQEPVSKETLKEQIAQPENLSEYAGTVFVPTMKHLIPADSNSVYCATLLFAWDEARKNMIFDKPFFLMLRRTDAQHPYFVLHAVNAELMVKE